LFLEVCSAIQHAHQKGIIHRDIKPSNILVTLHGDKPVPKVIDFGVAKATQGRLTEKTLFTQFQQFIGTPAYMSPEQASLSGLDIDTRSDIYALGVLLYELLTGRTPFDGKELLQAGLDEMRRTIREKQPPRPSNRISTLQGEDLTTTAKQRRTDPPKLVHLVRGDLDWIVMKALEKDRARRYETANGLAADIKRHLGNEPIVARPPSGAYRFQKLVRRNKLAFFAAGAVMAALVIGLGVATWMFFKEQKARQQADTQRKIAETEAAKATAISGFMQEMLRSASPEALKGSDYTVRQMLDDFSSGLANQLAGQPEVEAQVRATLGKAYERLGVLDKAQGQFERALALRRRLYGDQSQEVAHSLLDHAWLLYDQLRPPEAGAEVRQALDIYRRRGAPAESVVEALSALGVFLNSQQRFTEVESVSEQALALARNSPGREFPEIANVLGMLANAKFGQGKYLEAEKLAQQGVEMNQRLHGADHPDTAWTLLMLGRALDAQQKFVEAEGRLREALAIFRRYYSFQQVQVQWTLAELKIAIEARGGIPALEALYRELLVGQRAALGDDSPTVAETWTSLADALQRQGKEAEAKKALGEAIEITLNLNGSNAATIPALVQRQAATLNRQSKSEEVEKLYEKAIDVIRQKLSETDPAMLRDFGNFLLYQAGKPGPAVEQYLKAVKVYRANTNEALTWTCRELGDALMRVGKPTEAQPYLREALALYRKWHQNEDRWGTAYPNLLLGDALDHEHRWPEAEQAYRDALTAYTKSQALDDENYSRAVQSLLGVLKEENKLADGEVLCRETLVQQRAAFGNDNLTAVGTLLDLADFLMAQGKQAEAEKASQEAVNITRKLTGQITASLPMLLHRQAQALKDRGKSPEAEKLFENVITVARQKLGETNLILGELLHDYGDFLSSENKYEAAVLYFRQSLPSRRLQPDGNLAWTLRILGGDLVVLGRPGEGEPYLRESIALGHKLYPNEDFNGTAWPSTKLGDALYRQHKLPEAEQAYRDALSGYAKCRALGDENYAYTVQSLLGLLKEENKLAEGEVLCREILAQQRAVFTNDNPAVAQTLIGLAENLAAQGKLADAETVWREVLTPQIENKRSSAGLWHARADVLARQGLWREATTAAAKAVELEPANHENYHSLAPLLAHIGDLDGYRHCCAQMLSRFGPTAPPYLCERMAKDCLFLQCPGVELTTAAKLANSAVTRGQGDAYFAFFQFAQGLAEYRTGNFSNAVDSMVKVIAVKGWPFRDAEANAVLAMAQQRLRHKEEARAALSSGARIFAGMDAPESGDLGGVWNDWIIANALLKEAKALIEGQPLPATTNPPSSASPSATSLPPQK
jgi:tetratricopeptide (TPR) repeat protein